MFLELKMAIFVQKRLKTGQKVKLSYDTQLVRQTSKAQVAHFGFAIYDV